MDDAPHSQKQWIDCPGCRESFDLLAEPQAARTVAADGLMRCPYCSTSFPAPPSAAKEPRVPEPTNRDPEPEFFVTDDLPLDYEQNVVRGGTQIGDQMSADKVHRLAAARRNAYRRRSWFAISSAVLAVAAINVLLLIVRHFRIDGMSPRVIAYTGAVVLMLLIAARLIQRAMQLTSRLRESDLDEPTEAPNFASLETEQTDTPDWHRANQN